MIMVYIVYDLYGMRSMFQVDLLDSLPYLFFKMLLWLIISWEYLGKNDLFGFDFPFFFFNIKIITALKQLCDCSFRGYAVPNLLLTIIRFFSFSSCLIYLLCYNGFFTILITK